MTNGNSVNNSANPASSKASAPSPAERPDKNSLFPRINLLMMGGCVAMIIIGFLLMSGGSSSIEHGFNPDIFSTRRIVVGPAIAFLGFLFMAFAIIWTPRRKRF